MPTKKDASSPTQWHESGLKDRQLSLTFKVKVCKGVKVASEIPKNLSDFNSLINIVASLRGPNGCPWDQEQTHQSLSRFAIEEAHELAEAIDSGLDQNMIEELGDLMLQVVLHSEIARQEERFSIEDVISNICNKMVRRHPHVFGDLKVQGSKEVLSNWAKIKAEEKGLREDFIELRNPEKMPSLITAHKIGEKTAEYHFDWQEPKEVMAKIEEELEELRSALASKKSDEIEHEIGDLLFSLAQLARHLEMEGESALRKTNHRFAQRFKKMQEFSREDSKIFTELSKMELEWYWSKAKENEASTKQKIPK
ncbi:MAG: nucleoside triphosphate pyrophosphohydrolase [Bdellovibrionales bacterium]|nr:nucleoside triphosphate pyrophosphohydrolase [Bdellovibrionales bacterium]